LSGVTSGASDSATGGRAATTARNRRGPSAIIAFARLGNIAKGAVCVVDAAMNQHRRQRERETHLPQWNEVVR
jgi:hypothetical protein